MFAEETRDRLAALTRYFMAHGVADPALASHKAIIAIASRVREQATIMAFGDTFYLLGAALVVALIASLLLKKPDHVESAGSH